MEKVFVSLLYKEGTDIDNTFKTLSRDPWMKDKFVFVALKNPTDQLMQGATEEDLPLI